MNFWNLSFILSSVQLYNDCTFANLVVKSGNIWSNNRLEKLLVLDSFQYFDQDSESIEVAYPAIFKQRLRVLVPAVQLLALEWKPLSSVMSVFTWSGQCPLTNRTDYIDFIHLYISFITNIRHNTQYTLSYLRNLLGWIFLHSNLVRWGCLSGSNNRSENCHIVRYWSNGNPYSTLFIFLFVVCLFWS